MNKFFKATFAIIFAAAMMSAIVVLAIGGDCDGHSTVTSNFQQLNCVGDVIKDCQFVAEDGYEQQLKQERHQAAFKAAIDQGEEISDL